MPKTKTSSAPRLPGSITPNPSGTWTYRYCVNGKQREETKSTREEAIDRQAEIWRAKRAGETVFPGKSSQSQPFVTYCLEWIGSGGRRESTATVYRSTLKCMLRIAPELASMTMAQVAKDRPLAKRMIQQAPASYKKRIRTLLLSPCNEAVDDELIAPHNLACLGKSAGIRETDRRAEFKYIEREDLERFAKALAPTDRCATDYGLLVWLQRLTGLRISEALGVVDLGVSPDTAGGFSHAGTAALASFDAASQAGDMRGVHGQDVLSEVNHNPLRPDYHQERSSAPNGSHSVTGSVVSTAVSNKASDRLAIMKASMRRIG
jgi:hypothetical protein